jgi:hypothetical protein
LACADRCTQRDEHEIIGIPRVPLKPVATFPSARVQPILPIIQQPQPLAGGSAFLIGEIVSRSCKRVQRRDVGTHVRGHEPGGDWKVLIVSTRDPLAFGICGAQHRPVDLRDIRIYRQEGYCIGDSRCATS